MNEFREQILDAVKTRIGIRTIQEVTTETVLLLLTKIEELEMRIKDIENG